MVTAAEAEKLSKRQEQDRDDVASRQRDWLVSFLGRVGNAAAVSNFVASVRVRSSVAVTSGVLDSRTLLVSHKR